jgi:hypothetical protein
VIAAKSICIGPVPAARRIGPVLNFSLYVRHFTAKFGHWTNTPFEPDRREAIMPSPENQTRSKPGIDWLGIVRIVLLQILILLALSAGVVRYVNWSSDAARAEFTARGKSTLFGPTQPSQPATPIEVVKGQKVCPRKA